ncbi:MAG: diguanylate cyclase [Peptococcaceae bacterium]|nr:diguanylate cyclase [Peptococcaceae bacterium]
MTDLECERNNTYEVLTECNYPLDSNLILDLSNGFINLPVDQFDHYVQYALERIGKYFDVDRAFLYLFSKDLKQMSMVNEWCSDGITPLFKERQNIEMDSNNWWFSEIQKKNCLAVTDINDLPPEAVQEIGIWLNHDIQSLLAVVIKSNEKMIGFLGIQAVKFKRKWTDEHIAFFNIITKMLSNAWERKRWETKLAAERNLLSVTLNSIRDAVISVDEQLKIVMFNKAAEEITGYSHEPVLGKTVTEVLNILYPDGKRIRMPAQKIINAYSQEIENENLVLKDCNGVTKSISLDVFPIRNAEKNMGAVLVVKDVTESKKTEEEIKYLSYNDKLTGLYNRAYFEKQLSELDKAGNLPISIIMADCNGLKIVNDAFGHEEGDRLLVETARIVQEACRKDDIVARIGGDEFAVILPRVSKETAYRIIHRIKDNCANEKSLVVAPSLAMGLATKIQRDEDINDILKKAEDIMYSVKLSENKSMRSSILLSLRKTLEERTHETEEHASRLRVLSAELGKRLALNDTQMTELALLSLLHDIGKIATPDYILNKPYKLTEEEWDVMKKHSEAGYRIAASSPELAFIADYILSHHEKWDGNGYPEGLKRYQIPLLSRIISVVDAYDAMTSERAYKTGLSKEEALAELERCAGTQFDPAIVKTFIEIIQNQK